MHRLSRFLVLAAVPLSLPAQQTLWSRVPAFPASCYWDSTFANSLAKTKELLDTELHQQEAINDSITKAMHSGGANMAAGMQAAMMKDPAGAQKTLQAISEMGTEAYQNEQMRVLKKEEDIEATFPAVDSAFQPAFHKATDPIWADYRKGGDGEGSKAATPAELAALKKRFDDAYTPVCTQYYKPGAKYAQWLAAYKDYWTKENIPQNDKTFNTTRDMLAFYGLNVTNYKNTNTMVAVSHYLEYMSKAYAKMPGKPNF